MPRALIRAPHRRSSLSSRAMITGPAGIKALTSNLRRRRATSRLHQRFRLSTRWSFVKVGACERPTTVSIAVMVRRAGVRSAPVTSTSTWRKVGPVKQDRNGSNQVHISSYHVPMTRTHRPELAQRGRMAHRFCSMGLGIRPRLDGHGVISNNRHPVAWPIAWEVVMAARDREEILTRYRRLREISTRHHSEALRFIPRSVLLEQARRLGLTAGEMLVADSMDELTLAFDLCLYTAAPGRSRGIDRYARSAGVAPGSDEELMLKAMGQASFSLFRVEGPHETAGLLVRDLMREEGLWLVDENLERTAPVGLTLAMRVSRPETFAMTCGVMVPPNAVLIDEGLDEVQGRVRGEPAAIANDRRFATAIYRI